MRWIALCLLVGVFLAHDGAYWLAEGTVFAPQWVFYMLQGAWTVTLSAVLLIFVFAMVPSIWRNLCIAALIISIIEGAEIAVCPLIAGARLVYKPLDATVCTYATGIPLGHTVTWLEVLILAWMIGSYLRR